MPIPAAALAELLNRPGASTQRSQPAPPGPTADLLARVPLFSGLGRRPLHQLAKATSAVRFRSGAKILTEGQPGATFFVILSGQASVTKKGRRLSRLKSGDHFGELALLDGGPRAADVIAESDVLALRLDRSAFLRLVRSDPRVATTLLAEIAGRLRETTKKVEV